MARRPLLTGVAAVFILFCILSSLGSSGNEEIGEITRCRAHMLLIAAAEEMYYDLFGRYTVVFADLEEVSPGVSELYCPEDPGHGQYTLCWWAGPPQGYSVTCGYEPYFHGSILDGVPSWE